MSRRIRFIPQRCLVEITCRTMQGRFLLRPSKILRRRIIGVLSRAQELYGVEIHAFTFLSNHYHLLITVENAEVMARFMNYVQSNVAREAGRLAEWREKFWGRRYQAIVVTDEEAAQLERLEYVLAQGCKEGLVPKPQDWPGAQSTRALLSGRNKIGGEWIDRTAQHRARQRGEDSSTVLFRERQAITLTPLPCMVSWRLEDRLEWFRERCRHIAEQLRGSGRRPLGRESILKQDRHARPRAGVNSPAPLVHAATRRSARKFHAAYGHFLLVYRAACEKLPELGPVGFPRGCFRPALPFVTT